jgi:hypothetical protein
MQVTVKFTESSLSKVLLHLVVLNTVLSLKYW